MKIRITLIRTEVALSPVFLRLAYIQDEGYRARAMRSALPMLLETGQLPRWFTSMPVAQGPLPRSLTVRINLVVSDPCHQWVIARLSTMPDSDRATWLKSLMAKSLGLKTDIAPSGGLTPSPATAASPYPIPPSTVSPASSSESTPESPTSNATPADDHVRKQAHRKALRAFDIAHLNGPNH